jgi:transposase-like protein
VWVKARFEVHANQITQWKIRLQERASDVFATTAGRAKSAGPDVKELHAKIGQLAMEPLAKPQHGKLIFFAERGEKRRARAAISGTIGLSNRASLELARRTLPNAL